MKNHLIIFYQNRSIKILLIALTLALALVLVCSGWFYVLGRSEGKVTCLDFNNYNDALRAYTAGAVWLDRDGDGIPCEALYAHDNPGQHGE